MGGPSYSPQVAQIIRYAGLIIPAILVAYGYVFAFEWMHNFNFISDDFFTGVSIVWMIIALWQFVAPPTSRKIVLLRLSLYYVISSLYMLFVIGLSSPFVVFWVLLMITANIYLGRKGVLWNVLIFLGIVIGDILLNYSKEPSVIVYDLSVLVAILLSGLLIMNISKAQEIDRLELRRSHKQELLQRDRILTIINNLADGVISIDAKGIIRVYNAASLDLLDTNQSPKGHHIDVVLPLTDSDGAPVVLSQLFERQTGVHTYDDYWFTFEDGEKIRLEITISPIHTSYHDLPGAAVGDGFIIILRDVTHAKSLEEERDEFISVVSHELRTPTTVVEGSLSNIAFMLNSPAMPTTKLKSMVTTAHEQVLYLARMINDLSTLSRAERGLADEKESIDVEAMIESLYATYEPEAHSKGLTFNLDTSARIGHVHQSRLYLEELLQNFITNSIKYTKKGSVTLAAHRHGDEIIFAVKDTGIGISKPEQSKIFEKFYRSEDYRTRETGGTGLGLYVVSKLARKLRTEVKLTSRLNHGSTFSFTLPIEKHPRS